MHTLLMWITTDKLDQIMRNKIIPLLQGVLFMMIGKKIQIVLGDHHKQLKATKDAK